MNWPTLLLQIGLLASKFSSDMLDKINPTRTHNDGNDALSTHIEPPINYHEAPPTSSFVQFSSADYHTQMDTPQESLFYTPDQLRRRLEDQNEAERVANLQYPNFNVTASVIDVSDAILSKIAGNPQDEKLDTADYKLTKQGGPWKKHRKDKAQLKIDKKKGSKLRGAADNSDEMETYTSVVFEQHDSAGNKTGHAIITIGADGKSVSGILYEYTTGNINEQTVTLIQPPAENSTSTMHTSITLGTDAQMELARNIDIKQQRKPLDTPEEHVGDTSQDTHGRRLHGSIGLRKILRTHAFSKAAVADLGGMANARARAAQQVALMNYVIGNSGELGKYIQHQLYQVVQVDYTGVRDASTDLNYATSNIPRGTGHAITFSLTSYETSGCGIAWLFGYNKNIPLLPGNQAYTLSRLTSVVNLACDLSRYSVIHEDIHTWGGNHDPANAMDGNWFPYGCGWVKTSPTKGGTVGDTESYVDFRFPIVSFIGKAPAGMTDPDFMSGTQDANNAAVVMQTSQIIGDFLGMPVYGSATFPPVPYPLPGTTPTLPKTSSPTAATYKPTKKPTARPTRTPTRKPSTKATGKPTPKATLSPTVKTTLKPTPKATLSPTVKTTLKPTTKGTPAPTLKATPMPTVKASRSPTSYPTKKITSSPTALSQTPLLPVQHTVNFNYVVGAEKQLTVMLDNMARKLILTKGVDGKVSFVMYNMNGRPKPTIVNTKEYTISDTVLQKMLSPDARYTLTFANNQNSFDWTITFLKKDPKSKPKNPKWIANGKPQVLMQAQRVNGVMPVKISFPGLLPTQVTASAITASKALSGRLLEEIHTVTTPPKEIDFNWQEIVDQHLNHNSLMKGLEAIGNDPELVTEIKSSLNNINTFLIRIMQNYMQANMTDEYIPSVNNLLINILSSKLGTELLAECDLRDIYELSEHTECPIACFFYDQQTANVIFANSDYEEIDTFFANMPIFQRYYYIKFVEEDVIAESELLNHINDTKEQAANENAVRAELLEFIKGLSTNEATLNKQLHELIKKRELLSLIGLNTNNFDHFVEDLHIQTKITKIPEFLIDAIKKVATPGVTIKQPIQPKQ